MKNAVVISLVCVSLLLASCGREQSPTSPGDGPVLDLQDTVDQQIANVDIGDDLIKGNIDRGQGHDQGGVRGH